MSDQVDIKSSDFWVKVVGMLQQNWAVIEPEKEGGVRIQFITDTSGVFDEIAFNSESAAHEALSKNGFRRISHDRELQAFLRAPTPPFHRSAHPNGPIYSSGRFWRT